MRPTRLFAKNYGPYPQVDWAVPEGVTAILGRHEGGEGIDSNGAGKTRLLEIIPIALYGPTGPWSDYLTVGGAQTTCEVGVEFEHAGSAYRVRRTFTATGRSGKTTLDFERLDPNEGRGEPVGGGVVLDHLVPFWVPLTQDNQAATQESIVKLLGAGEATFSHSVFAAQGARHFADAELTPRERFAVFAEGLGLNVYDEFREHAAGERSALQSELEGLRARLGDWEEQLAGREFVEAELVEARASVKAIEAEVTAAKIKHDELETRYRGARAAREAVNSATSERDALAATHTRLLSELSTATAAKATFASITAEVDALRPAAVGLDTLTDELQALRDTARLGEEAKSTVARLMADAALKRAAVASSLSRAESHELLQAAKLAEWQRLSDAETGTCERCGQTLAGDALKATLGALNAETVELNRQAVSLRADAAALESEAVELEKKAAAVVVPEPADPEQLAAAEKRVIVCREAERELAVLEERLRHASELAAIADDPEFAASLVKAAAAAAAATLRVTELEAAHMSEEEVNRLATDTLGAEVAADDASHRLSLAQTALGAREERSRALAEVAVANAQAIGQANALAFNVEVRKELEKAYGRAGIPVLLLESLYIPKIEREANEILAAWGVPYTVELVTLKEQKTSERLKDTLEVVIHEPNGVRRYQTYSGGERDRINVALRISLARLLAGRHGAALEVFALDELAHLDATGIEKLAELLQDLQREIPVVLFISHDASLTDSFDQRVTVVRDAGGSRLEDAA